MSWPQLSGNSNVFRQSYVSGFLDVSGSTTVRNDLTIMGRLVVPTIVNNSTVTSYSLIVAEDISLNGRLYIGGGSGANFLQGNAYMIDVSGTNAQTGTVRIFEDKGTLPTATTGSLVLQHNDASGVSSILFPSKSNLGLDYASIAYYESISGGLSGGSKYNYYGASTSTTSSALVLNVQRDTYNAADVSSIDSIILQATGSVIVDACGGSVLGQTIIQPRGGNVGIGKTNPQYPLDVNGVIRSNNLPKFWNSDRLALSNTGTATTKYLLLGTLGDWNSSGNYGSMNIKGSLGAWLTSGYAKIDTMIMTRGQPSSAPFIGGIIHNFSTTVMNSCDIAIYYTGTTGTTSGPIYYVYLVMSPGGAGSGTQYINFDLSVTGNNMNTLAVNLAEPTSTYTTTTPTGTLVTSSVCSTVASTMTINSGNVGFGTTNPLYNLDVSGNLRTSGTLNITSGASTGTLSMNGAVLTTGNVVSLTSGASSSSTGTGALQVTGGVGIGGNINIGGNTSLTVGSGATNYNNWFGKVPPTGDVNTSTVKPNTTNAVSSTWINNNVTWSASASSVNGTLYAYYAFNTTSAVSTDKWESAVGTYASGSPTSTAGLTLNIYGQSPQRGEWLQIQSSVPLVMYSYSFISNDTPTRLPKTFWIVGSNDGANWYQIQTASCGATQYSSTAYTMSSTFLVNSASAQTSGSATLTTTTNGSYTTTAYTYFRLIALSIFGTTETLTDIGEWNITFNPSTLSGPSRTLLYMDASNINQLDVSGSLALVNTNVSSMIVSPVATISAGGSNVPPSTWIASNITWAAVGTNPVTTYEVGASAFDLARSTVAASTANYPYMTVSGKYNYTTGAYTGSQTTTNIDGSSTINGEYLQIQSSIPLIFKNYNFLSRVYNSPTYSVGCLLPASYRIVASNDGSTWVSIHDASFTAAPISTSTSLTTSQPTAFYNITTSGTATQQSNNSITGYSAAANAYTYFRIIVKTMIGTQLGFSNGQNDTRLNFFWTPYFSPASSSAVSLALDNATPNQLNIGGALGIAGGITPLYSTPSLGPGQVGQVLQGSIPTSWGGSAYNAGIAITPGVWLVTFYIYCTSGALNYFVSTGNNVVYTTSSVTSYNSTYPCSGTYIYTATSPTTIYLWSAQNAVSCTVGYSYHTAVRIA